MQTKQLRLRNQGRTKGEGSSTANKLKPPQQFYCWPSQGGSSVLVLVILDVVCRYLFLLYININIGKKRC